MRQLLLAFTALSLAACAQAPAGTAPYGTSPQLNAPSSGLLPTVRTADPVRWAEGEAPTAPAGFTVTRFAEGLDHPRWIYLLPNGDVLVAESSTEPSTGGGIIGWVRNQVQRSAGAVQESANRITLLRDADRDGVAETQHVFAQGLKQPIGMVLVGDYVYVGNTNALVRFRYTPGATSVSGEPETVLELPYQEGNNGHWTRNVVANADGTKLYVSVGSVSNVPKEDGFAAEEGRAAIWEVNPDGSGARVFASGLRNPVGMSWQPESGMLWTSVNERDEIGDNLPPDYMTSVRDGAFYGWPYSYWGQNVDARVTPQRPELVATALTPDFALGAHTASLGLHFYTGQALPARYRNGAFVGQHGSWNRSEFIGYKVAFVPFSNGTPSGEAEDFLTDFLNADHQARGRPVGVAQDATGALLVADDVGNIIWRVASTGPASAPAAE